MARSAVITKAQLRSWFADLSFNEQKSVLKDLSDAHNSAKHAQIEALRSELALLESEAASTKANGHGKAIALTTRKGPRAGTKVAPKYRDRKSNVTWTGRGLQPLWVREHVKKGGTLEDLLIRTTRKGA
jgi:DNA-binding protein H-NS